MTGIRGFGFAAAFLASCLTAQPAWAGGQSSWSSEPESFLGIRLAEPFAVAACPVKTMRGEEVPDWPAIRQLEGVCFNPTALGMRSTSPTEARLYELENKPSLGFEYRVLALVSRGVVSRITLDLDQAAFGALQAAFVARYGPPTSEESKPFKTKGGAEFTSATLRWEGAKMTIRMHERYSRADRAQAVVFDNAIYQREVEAAKERLKGEASKF